MSKHEKQVPEDMVLLSLRFTKSEFQHVQEAMALRGRLTAEEFISALCEQDVLDEKEHPFSVRHRRRDKE